MTLFRRSLVASALCLVAFGHPAWAQVSEPPNTPAADYVPDEGQAGKDVIWLPTAQSLVDRMLRLAELTPKDHLIDLGSGDGRLVITAAQRGATAHGIEYNPELVAYAQRAAASAGMGRRATFEKADIFESDFSKATVITLFLLPDLNMRLRPTLLAMKPGTRIVSNSFDMGDWEPDETVAVKESCTTYCNAHKWTVPAQAAGTWRFGNSELVLTQTFQKLEGTLRQGGSTLPISEARMHGTRIAFVAGGQRYSGEVDGARMRGTVDGKPWRASRS
ncbi:MAG: methyltransferase domain-containing protein [Hydrogenophaga sp.]|nr:methyltransferase domain-containing protein [Hydrogenophaga sp.]